MANVILTAKTRKSPEYPKIILMRIFDFKHLFLLLAALVLLGACGKSTSVSTDFIAEDERNWNEQQVRIYKDPENPENTIIEDEYGRTVIGPNGEILAQELDESAPTFSEAEPTKEEDKPIAPPVADTVSPSVTEIVEPEVVEPEVVKPELPTFSGNNEENYVMLPMQEEEDVENDNDEHTDDHDHSEVDEPAVPSFLDWQNFSLTFPYEDTDQTDFCAEHPNLRDVVEFGQAIETLGGKFVDPYSYEKDLMGFSKYLSDVGVKYFTAYEMTLPGNKTYAKSCDEKILLPNKGCWIRSAALALAADKIRGNQKRAIKMTSHYRSSCYNKKVGGKKNSDHLSSRAMDLSFGGKELRQKAQDFICKTFWKDDLVGLKGLTNPDTKALNISIGLGQSFMHMGLGSKHGRRYWVYSSYKNGGNKKGTCWTKKL